MGKITVMKRPDCRVFLNTLFRSADDVREFRAFYKSGEVRIGYCKGSEVEAFIDGVLVEAVRQGMEVYVTVNPVATEYYSENSTQFEKRTKAVRDNNIQRYEYVFVDIDPVRPSGESASDEEKQAAMDVGDALIEFCKQLGWPEPIIVDSGNGIHVYWLVNLSNTKKIRNLMRRVLEIFDFRHSTDKARIDTKVYNASRITRITGILNRKGKNTAERPWRLSRIISIPDSLEEVPLEKLEALVAEYAPPSDAPKTSTFTSLSQEELQALLEEKVGIKAIIPYKGGTLFRLKKCIMNDAHENAPDLYVILWPDGGITAKCFHDSCKKAWKTKDFCEKLGIPYTKKGKAKKSQADILLDLVFEEDIELFHTPEKEPFARVPIFKPGKVSHYEVIPISGLNSYLQGFFYQRTGKAINNQALYNAKGVLEARALFEGATRNVYRRVAMKDGCIYIDPCWDDRRIIKVSSEEWQILNSGDVKDVYFIRSEGMLPLPFPAKEGNFDLLRKYARVRNEDGFILLQAWILNTFFPKGVKPLLVFLGAPGSLKTSTAWFLKLLIDPSDSPVRLFPITLNDIFSVVKNNWLVVFDNVSSISHQFSDALCGISTGTALGKRELYRNSKEHVIKVCRPIIVTAIDISPRPDLADRMVIIELESPSEYVPFEDLLAEFEQDKPKIFRANLDVLVVGLQNIDRVKPSGDFRMSDFEKVALACEPAFCGEGRFLQAYLRNRKKTAIKSLDENPLIHILNMFLDTGGFEGTISQLHIELQKFAKGMEIDIQIPSYIGRILRNSKKDLAEKGIYYEEIRTAEKRLIRVWKEGVSSLGECPLPSPDIDIDRYAEFIDESQFTN